MGKKGWASTQTQQQQFQSLLSRSNLITKICILAHLLCLLMPVYFVRGRMVIPDRAEKFSSEKVPTKRIYRGSEASLNFLKSPQTDNDLTSFTIIDLKEMSAKDALQYSNFIALSKTHTISSKDLYKIKK